MSTTIAEAITFPLKFIQAESDRQDVKFHFLVPTFSPLRSRLQGSFSTSTKIAPNVTYDVDYFIDVEPYSYALAPRIYRRNPEMVETYLARYPEIEGFINASWPTLLRAFGKPVDIVLEVMVYPEEAPYSTLIGWIQSTDDVYEGLEKFEQFQDEWFLDHISEIGNRFNFNIETI